MSQDEIARDAERAPLSRAAPRDVRETDGRTFTGAATPCTRTQAVFAATLSLAVVVGAITYPEFVTTAVHDLLLITFVGAALLRLTAVALAPPPAPADLEADPLPRYSIIAPLYREAAMIDQLVGALAAIDYPPDRLQVLLTLEADDTETLEAVQKTGLPPGFEIVVAPPGHPRTKPRACNVALEQATGEFVVIYDAEDRPAPGQLLEAAALFASESERMACLQAPLTIDPGKRFLGRQFALEYALQFQILIPAFARLGLPFPLGGTSNHFRTSVLRELGGWDAFNVTEDADIGFRLAHNGYRLGAISLPTWEAPADTWRDWLPQRTRWVKGFMQTWGVYMREPFAGGWKPLLMLQLTLGLSILSSVIHGPIVLWLLLSLGLLAAGLGGQVSWLDASVLGLGWLACAIGSVAGARRCGFPVRLSDLVLAPFYWPLLSLAAFRAMHQLIVRPFHWDKTNHLPSAGRDEGQAAIEQA